MVAQVTEITVPEGARLPVVLSEIDPDPSSDGAGTQIRDDILDGMTRQFAAEIAKAEAESQRAGETPAEYLNRWQQVADKAEAKFRGVFGVDAYMRWSIRNHLQLLGLPSKYSDPQSANTR